MQLIHEKRNMLWYLFIILLVSAGMQPPNSEDLSNCSFFHFYYMINGIIFHSDRKENTFVLVFFAFFFFLSSAPQLGHNNWRAHPSEVSADAFMLCLLVNWGFILLLICLIFIVFKGQIMHTWAIKHVLYPDRSLAEHNWITQIHY